MARPRRPIVEYRIYELPPNFPILLLDGENWRISETPSVHLHFHNCFEIGICHSHRGVMLFENDETTFCEGDISCVSRHIAHTTYSAKGDKSLWSYLFLDFEKLLSGDSGAKMPEIDFHKIFSREEYSRLHFYIESVIDEIRDMNAGYEMAVRGIMSAIYCELMRVAKSDTGDYRKHTSHTLAPALNYIHTNYMDRFSTEHLAKLCNLSETHFRRKFLSVMGATPLSFINQVRIDHASELLAASSDSILTISEAVGFVSISSFNRCFLQIMGVSPRNYRISRLKQNSEIKPKLRNILPYSGWLEAEE